MPIIPQHVVRSTASVRDWRRVPHCLAPIAMRMPIFPTIREMEATAPRRRDITLEDCSETASIYAR
jgi:hypothetical protein